MKRSFGLVTVCVMLMAVFTFVGCDEEELDFRMQLDAPMWGSISKEVLLWNEVSGASDYAISINEQEYEVVGNHYLVSDLNEGVGKAIRVKAKGGEEFRDSEWSAELIIDKIMPPTNIEITETGELVWAPDENAKGYSVNIFDENENLVKSIEIPIQLTEANLIRVQTEDLLLGKYSFEILPFATLNAHANLSEKAKMEFVKSMFEKHLHSFSKSGENLHSKASFKMREDLEITNYNFVSTDPAEQLAEYNKAYQDLFEGSAEERAVAINTIGNDVIFQHHYFKDGKKVIISTKNKAWSGYLNKYTDLENSTPIDIENIAGPLIGQTLDSTYYFRTNTNIANPADLNTDNDTVFVEFVIIKDGRVFDESAEMQV